jgi:hypothetical protein
MPAQPPFDADHYAQETARNGYAIREGVLSNTEVEHLRLAVAQIPNGEEVRRRRGVYGVRNLLEICPACSQARIGSVGSMTSSTIGKNGYLK